MDPVEERTDFERSNNLPPVEAMTQEERLTEKARVNGDSAHPHWDLGHVYHKQAVERMGKLFSALGPGPTNLDKSFSEAGIKNPEEEIKQIQAKGFSEITRDKVQRQFEEIRNKLALASLGDPIAESFEEVVGNAQGLVSTLVNQKIVDPEFTDFLDESEIGNSPQAIKLFSDLNKLIGKFTEWQKYRKGGK
jgi:hypothetical protein